MHRGRACLRDTEAFCPRAACARSERLSAWAVVDIACRIKVEVCTREGAILSVRLVDYRDMWRDALLLDQPVQHRS